MMNCALNNASALKFLKNFRDEVYQSFPHRADAAMDLLDAITSGNKAQSVVEHSLNPLFRREYGSVHDAIHHLAHDPIAFKAQQQLWTKISAGCVSAPQKRSFYLLATDVTGCPRPFASTLRDRTINYHPNPVLKNKPIQVGHAYSLLAALPEKECSKTPPWIIPLSLTRVPSDQKAIQIAAAQTTNLLKQEQLPFMRHLTALAGDTAYSAPQFLHSMGAHSNLVVIVRVRRNRVFFLRSQEPTDSSQKGHPVWFKAPFSLKDQATWTEPDMRDAVAFSFSNDRKAVAHIMAWDNIIMRGKRNVPMHEHPFTLICITIIDADGVCVFKRPLWLIVMGKRRNEISLPEIYHAYRQRYDLEHFFRFGKQKLLLADYQTPEVQHEENWQALVSMAYTQLYCMATLAHRWPRPWERFLERFKSLEVQGMASPSETQRDALRILTETGTPAQAPKRRGIAPGRPKGRLQKKRERVQVIRKGKSHPSGRSP